MQDTKTIHDPASGAVFSSPLQTSMILALIAGPQTLSGLAGLMHISLSLMHYHLTRLVRLGLVDVVASRARAGRPTKIYRAVARTFLVPTEYLARLPGDDMARVMRDALEKRHARSVESVSFTHDGARPKIDLIRARDSRPQEIELWFDGGLAAVDAEQFMMEMAALMVRFRKRSSPDEPRYIAHMAAIKAPGE